MECSATFLILLFFVSVSSETVNEIYSSYRKDYFFPYDVYPEANLPDPTNGGRFHIVTVSQGNGNISSVSINGKQVTFQSGKDPDDWYVDWLHVYPVILQAGQPVWISFHTRDHSFNKEPNSASVKVTTSTGQTAINGMFSVQLTLCNITYITVNSNYSTLLVHVHNGYADSSRTIKTVLINGTNMTQRVSNQQSLSIAPLSSILLSIQLSKHQSPGNLVTVALEFLESGSVSVGTGVRLAKTHFPIESWPKSHECPFPTINDDNYKFHRDHGIDTFFFGQGAAAACGKSTPGSDIAGKLAPQYGFYCLINVDIPHGSIDNSTNILARFLGDEADVHLDDGLRTLMQTTDQLWKNEQSFLTYVGGSRSRRSGIFAGVTDIQGMDMYVAACAPHIQEFFHPPPLRGSYDYMRLTRNNHMPLPTWTYSQLLDDGWNAKIGNTVINHREPNPDEARIQAMSVIAGCSKGIMYFQSEVSEQKYYPKTWIEIGNFNKDIGAVREYLRSGDCTDMVTTSDGNINDLHAHSVVQTIRSQEAIIITVINLKNDGGISDLKCEIGENLHWKISDHTISNIVVTIPSDFGSVVDSFEVRNGAIYDIPSMTYKQLSLGIDYHGNKLFGGSLSITNISMSSKLSTRMFVLANKKFVRQDIQNNLK